jgi:endonuclease YncB( thermonuclease family)
VQGLWGALVGRPQGVRGVSAPAPNYVHRARLAERNEIPPRAVPVHDGDTFYLRLDLGTYAGVRVDPVVEIRLQGIDTWELAQPLGLEARAFTALQLTSGKPITVQTVKPDLTPLGFTFQRTAAHVWIGDDLLADLPA